MRAMADLGGMLAGPREGFARPGLPERLTAISGGLPRFPAPGPDRAGLRSAGDRHSLVIARPMTSRWIWFVPSTICSTLASRMYRSAGKSST
ncbi:hypothetical protein Misp01_32930 [Microtetraspora sp. NBRC 13810]|nr:hypothetical protein Misp01_32930 [Microtetraspora sp. NBRC 13810]